MFERFSDDARQTVVRAQELARELRHEAIGAEHLFLALFDDPVTGPMLTRRGLTADGYAGTLTAGDAELGGHVPFTQEAKQALEDSLRESVRLRTGFIHSGHILLGLAKQNEGPVSRYLTSSGVNPGQLVEETEGNLPAGPGQASASDTFDRLRAAQAAVRGIAETFQGAPEPACSVCRAGLTENLRVRTLRAEGEDEEVPVRVYYCGLCGNAINAAGGDGGTAPARG